MERKYRPAKYHQVIAAACKSHTSPDNSHVVGTANNPKYNARNGRWLELELEDRGLLAANDRGKV